LPGVGGLIRGLGYITLFAALISIADKKILRPFDTFHYVIIAFLLWNLITNFWSIDPDISVTSSFRFIRVAGLFWLVYEFGCRGNEEIWLIRSYISGCLLAISQIVYSYATKGYLEDAENRITALGMNQNDLALVLVIGIGLTYYLVQVKQEKARLWKALYYFFMPLAAVAMLLTGSRAGFISLMVGAAYIVVVQRGVKLRYKMMMLVSIAAIFILSQEFLPETVYERFSSAGVEIREGTLTGRTTIWKAGLESFYANPFFGTGSGTFKNAIEPFYVSVGPHNAYLAVLVESGLVGLALYILLFAIAIYYTRLIPIQFRHSWRAILLMCMVGMFSLGWDYRKPPWLLFGLIINQSLKYRDVRSTATIKAPSRSE
jgi:O-antigen ligase